MVISVFQSQLIVFIVTLLCTYMLLNFWTRGFMNSFMRVRGMRDKGQLVMVNSLSDVYFRSGKLDGEWLLYKDRNKNNKRLRVSGCVPRRIFGFPVWEVDEEKNAVMTGKIKSFFGKTKEVTTSEPNLLVRSFEVVSGHDAVKTDNFFKRILMAPKVQDAKEIIIIVLLVAVVCIAGYAAYNTTSILAIVKATTVIKTGVPV